MTLTAPKVPCGSCPYRRDVPSGVWSREEYEKLAVYDGETWEQSPQTFLCHQQDGRLCGGWLACHGPQELLALRIPGRDLDPEVFSYTTTVPVFESGAAARDHGIAEIDNPSDRAQAMALGIEQKRRRQRR